MTTVAIMQPTFAPWIGYLAMMDSVDLFVFLDNVQFERRSWQQRNRIKTGNGPQWLTVPVLSKGLREQHICDVRIDQSSGFATKHIQAIRHAYGTCDAYDDYADGIADIIRRRQDRLVDLTTELIELLRTFFGVPTPSVLASSLRAEGRKAELLANICQALGAKSYLSPPGSQVYLDQTTAFRDRDIDVRYHRYDHPTYRQRFGAFESHMSSIDLLFNEGANSRDIMLSGIPS